ncbi:uncharacterized protein LOC101846775 [Aplysia californica]|uniref:Uncharacterized protein LOC101846775 n=1 Tax=Aplysia californica TaxID=6500 RepID=A0ABM0K792_APLCA|nr:uncharacterized protein LOC101846775 [Aplysia californica]
MRNRLLATLKMGNDIQGKTSSHEEEGTSSDMKKETSREYLYQWSSWPALQVRISIIASMMPLPLALNDFSPESSFEMHHLACRKNGNHEKFIPVKEFSFDHLPCSCRNKNVLTCIRNMAVLTVKVKVNFVSLNRPDTCVTAGSSQAYPFSNLRGRNVLRTGSGWVHTVENVTHTDCKCRACVDTLEPSRNWWQITVVTAAHVVYDDQECRNATFDLFYDDEDSREESMVTLQGHRVDLVDVDTDRCHLVCVTHDRHVGRRLQLAIKTCQNELHRLQSQLQSLTPTVVVSHPHGLSKRITVGERVRTEKSGGSENRLVYTTATCPGSSGGLVWPVGRKWNRHLCRVATHSESCGLYSMSSVTLPFCTKRDCRKKQFSDP